MKVKALIDCKGIGYDFKKGDTGVINKKLASKLIAFNYVKELAEKQKEESPETKVTE